MIAMVGGGGGGRGRGSGAIWVALRWRANADDVGSRGGDVRLGVGSAWSNVAQLTLTVK